MSTHNIGFYEDLTKIIIELSSNIIKYAPYFFCCIGTYCIILQVRTPERLKTPPLSFRGVQGDSSTNDGPAPKVKT